MTYIIAEIGNAHEGNPDEAITLVETALETGVDAVKMQRFTAATLLHRNTPSMAHTQGGPSQYERMESLELPWEVFVSAASLCRAAAVDFICTPFAPELVEPLTPLVRRFKIASGDLTYGPLLDAVNRSGKPVILSAGMADHQEIHWARQQFDSAIKVLHCVSLYPTPDDKENLLRAVALDGLSDHSIGDLACVGAAALGVEIIEKHYTLDKTRPRGDHAHSLEPAEMAALVHKVRRLEKMRDYNYLPDIDMREHLRRGEDGLRGVA